MKALSIRQPWAWAIVNGYKPVENRDWMTRYRGPLLIHAGKSIDLASYAIVRRLLAEGGDDPDDLPEAGALPIGGIVGQARLVNCVRNHPSHWFFGPWGFVLDAAEPLPLAPCRGSLGLFDVDLPSIGRAEPPAPGQGRML